MNTKIIGIAKTFYTIIVRPNQCRAKGGGG